MFLNVISFIGVILLFFTLTAVIVELTGDNIEWEIPLWYQKSFYYGVIKDGENNITFKFYLITRTDD